MKLQLELDQTDLLNLLKSVKPKSMQECDDFTKLGLMKFTGNQHNENWDWCTDKLTQFSLNELWILYIRMK